MRTRNYVGTGINGKLRVHVGGEWGLEIRVGPRVVAATRHTIRSNPTSSLSTLHGVPRVRTGSGTGSLQEKRAPRVGISSSPEAGPSWTRSSHRAYKEPPSRAPNSSPMTKIVVAGGGGLLMVSMRDPFLITHAMKTCRAPSPQPPPPTSLAKQSSKGAPHK